MSHAARFIACAFVVALGAACSGQPHDGGPIATPPCMPFDVTITSPGANDYPQIVWIGDKYLVPESQGAPADTILREVSADGVLAGNFTTIPQSEGAVDLVGESYAWSGSSLGVIVRSNTANTFELVRFAHDGTRLGTTTMTSGGKYPNPRVVWANDRFAVAWIDLSNSTVNLLEISPDGVLGTARQLTMADVGEPVDVVSGLVSTATSYAIRVSQIEPPANSPVIVVLDRTSGAVQRYDGQFAGAQLVARDPVFALLSGSSPARLETLDGSAMPGPIVSVSVSGGPTLLPTTAGYHVYDLMPASGPDGTNKLDAMDLDAQGSATDPERPVATISWPPDANASNTFPVAVFRGNGYAAVVGFISGTTNPTTTLHLLQQCTP